jgi:hypothetical protein
LKQPLPPFHAPLPEKSNFFPKNCFDFASAHEIILARTRDFTSVRTCEDALSETEEEENITANCSR